MIKITVPSNFTAQIDTFKRQHRYAVAVALTKTAQLVKEAEVETLKKTLDRPTPYTLKSLYMERATKQKLQARVWFKDESTGSGIPATKYLYPHVDGGARAPKRFEKALQAAGHLPNGWLAMPGQGANLDSYGNMSRGQIIQILSQLRVTLTAGYTRNMAFGQKSIAPQRKAGGRFFVIKPGGRTQPGVYQREFFGRGITPVMIFAPESGTDYKARFPFAEVAEKTVSRHFGDQFSAALDQAMATALMGKRDQVSLF